MRMSALWIIVKFNIMDTFNNTLLWKKDQVNKRIKYISNHNAHAAFEGSAEDTISACDIKK